MRRMLSLLAKAAVSILLLYFSLHSIDLGALGARLTRLESGWVVLALFLLTVQVVLLAVRWRNISGACGTNLPFTSALQISFIATFFNQVLPSTVGGDSMRIWLPPVLLVATLPVSIAGWGVRESSFMFAFAHAGLAQSDGLAISILFGAASFIV